jgi:hypothetical protein
LRPKNRITAPISAPTMATENCIAERISVSQH